MAWVQRVRGLLCAAFAVPAMAACSASSEAPMEGPTINWTVASVEGAASATSPESCDASGSDCRPLIAGEQLSAPRLIRTTTSSAATLELGAGRQLRLDERSELMLNDNAELTLLSGGAALQGTAQQNCDGTTLVVVGHRLRTSCTALRARLQVDGEDAILSVHRGALEHRDQNTSFAAGTTVALEPGRPADREAVFRGEIAPLSQPLWQNHEASREDIDVPPRGLGRMTARIPGTQTTVEGVRLASHEVRVTVRDGFARTEVIEEFANDTDRVLEGRFVFPLPPDASISRLALWVGNELVEGEMLERKRAARIFKGIVDDTVRPRDPALLEWIRGSEFSLKIFPIPARGSRKVLLAYNQALPRRGKRFEYRYPLSLGSERATTIDRFSVNVDASDSRAGLWGVEAPAYQARVQQDGDEVKLAFAADDFSPARDFVVRYRLEHDVAEQPAVFVPRDSEPGDQLAERSRAARQGGYLSMRLRATPAGPLPVSVASPARVFVLDRSQSQSDATWSAQLRIAEGLVARLGERFALLACDTDCDGFPASGLSDADELDAARRWLAGLRRGGATDLGGALDQGVARLGGDAGQLVYLGDGAASAGRLSAELIAAELAPALERQVDLRLLGIGSSVDEVMLRGIASLAGATYERVDGNVDLEVSNDRLTQRLQTPVIRRPRLETDDALDDVHPRRLPNLLVGEELMVLAKLQRLGKSELALSGTLGGQSYRLAKSVEVKGHARDDNPLVPRLWAEAEIATLQQSDDAAVIRSVVDLSKEHHVMSRHTALLVLENEQMYREFGIERTQRRIGESPATGSLEGLRDFGMVGLLGSADSGAANGNLWGSSVGSSAGSGGLGLKGLGMNGIGSGGGGRGKAAGTGSGFGSGVGRLGASRRNRPPRVRMGATSVSGRLPPEVIQRIVRQNFGRFRVCYEAGLRRNPKLRGRVSVRFVIGRDGRVSNVSGQGDIGDQGVVSCISRAFYSLGFPQPEGGIVTVSYPLMLAPSDSSPQSPSAGNAGAMPNRQRATTWRSTVRSSPSSGFATQRRPTTRHFAADEGWRSAPIGAIDRLRTRLDGNPRSRRAHELLIRALLAHGRFEEALRRAEHFSDIDSESAVAHELLGYAAAANGAPLRAAQTMASLVEMSPRDAAEQQRAARAYQALGQLARACAHWRSAAQLRPADDDVRWHDVACLAEQRGVQVATRRAHELRKPGKRLRTLTAALERQEPPTLRSATGAMGWFEATSDCRDADCPYVIVIADDGRVFSPWTPARARSAAHSVALRGRRAGRYRTVLVGGRGGQQLTVTLRGDDQVKRFTLERDAVGKQQTVAMSHTERSRWGWGRPRW